MATSPHICEAHLELNSALHRHGSREDMEVLFEKLLVVKGSSAALRYSCRYDRIVSSAGKVVPRYLAKT